MKARSILMTAVVLGAVLAFGGESFARGGGVGGGGTGGGQGMQVRNQVQTRAKVKTQTATQTAVRSEDSQRRDGTFLTTGTTASGSTTRPANGRGVMDGTGVNATVPTTTVVQ